jgi:crotonobetainyl-CoA:carnitine CoA-transferase CaiB-like acyl-CoA transferase
MVANDVERALAGLKVLDAGAGMSAALVSRFLADAGADVRRAQRAEKDLPGLSYPAYDIWRRNQRAMDVRAQTDWEAALEWAEVLLLGGENHPGQTRSVAGVEAMSSHPRLVVLSIEACPPFWGASGGPALDILAQSDAGIIFEHYSKRPNLVSFSPAIYGAVLQGLIGLFAALYERDGSGRGQIVSTSLFEGAMGWASSFRLQAEKPTPASSFCVPKDPEPLIFRCSDGRYVHIVLGSAGSKPKLYGLLGIEFDKDSSDSSGLPSLTSGGRNFFGDVDLIGRYVRERASGELLQALWSADIVADLCMEPGECWEDPQVKHTGIVRSTAEGRGFIGFPVSMKSSPAAWTRPASPPPVKPLKGLKVVDFGAFVAGPLSSTILSDLGADVVKVEPLSGDPNRSVFRTFTSANRGKRSIRLDLKQPQGLAAALTLCRNADVVTSNFRPGVAARLGIGADALHAMKPELIVLEASGFGTSGPAIGRPAFDMILQSRCGHEVHGGGQGGVPLWSRLAMVDYGCGFLGAVATLLAIIYRGRSGNGARVDISLLETGLYLFSEMIRRPDGTFDGVRPLDPSQTGFTPAQSLYEARDGWIALAVLTEAGARNLAAILGSTKLACHPREWTEAQRTTIAEAVASTNRDELLAKIANTGVWAVSAHSDAEARVLNDPGLIAHGTIHRYEHPEFGWIHETGALYRFSRSTRGSSDGPPALGQHTREVLQEIGYTTTEINTLIANATAV